MIAQLFGKLIHKTPTQSVIDCNGVGYEIFHTPFTSERMTADNVRVFIHTHIREDAFQLFAFADAQERSFFRELIKVSGVGPKMALGIMSGVPYDELVQAIVTKDMHRLQKIPGVGKKTAERVVLELIDRLKNIEMPIPESSAAPRESELESVLLNLGYQKAEIQRAVKSLKNKQSFHEQTSLEGLIKITLREMAQGKTL